MKRIAILLIGFMLVAVSSQAVPVKRNMTRTVTLSDGSTVTVTLKGDEYSHWWETEGGAAVSIDEYGTAALISDSDLEEMQSAGAQRKAASNAVRGKRLARARKSDAKYTGEKKGLVILVNFANKSFASETPQEDFDRQFNEAGYSDNNHVGSVADYFSDQSYGEFALEFDIVGPVTVSQNYSYYGENNSGGNDRYPCTLVIEACDSIDAEVDFSQYDWDDDGEVDQVFLVYAGYGENAGAASSTIWPHEWCLSEGVYYSDGDGVQTYDGVTVDTYAMTCELSGTSGTTLDGIGTACHEFSHCLGFPDFYDTSYSGGWGMESWDLLDSGSYNGPDWNGEVPAGYTAYERWAAGWLEPTEITADTEVTDMQPLNDYPEAYVLYNDADENEYYLLENRKSDKWFSYVYNYEAPSGMLILHVDYDAKSWAANTPNSDADHQRMTMFQANNDKGTYYSSYGSYSISESQYMGHLYPYAENNSLTASSTPAATLYNKNSVGTEYMLIGIYGITMNDDGTMAFYCDSTAVPTTIFYESFDSCDGTGGNDGLWNGTAARGTFVADNDGWTATYKYGADECAKFGTSTVAGEATTPTFTFEGDAILTFKAAPWSTSGEDRTFTVTYSDGTSFEYTLARGEWTKIEESITGSGDMQITFTGGGRFFLDEVMVVADETDGITTLKAASVCNQDGKIYSITGQYVGTTLSALPAGVYVMNGKKLIRK